MFGRFTVWAGDDGVYCLICVECTEAQGTDVELRVGQNYLDEYVAAAREHNEQVHPSPPTLAAPSFTPSGYELLPSDVCTCSTRRPGGPPCPRSDEGARLAGRPRGRDK